MREVILFVFTFLFGYLLYYFFTIRKELNKIDTSKKRKKKKKVDEAKIPTEIQYIIMRYHLDKNKLPYFNFLRVVGIVTSIDMAIIVAFVSRISGTGPQLLVGFCFLLPLILISYHVIGKYYQKKGMRTDV